MATQLVKLRRSATAGAIPSTAQLELGELALNTYDGKVYMKKDAGGELAVVEVGGGDITGTRNIDIDGTITSNGPLTVKAGAVGYSGITIEDDGGLTSSSMTHVNGNFYLSRDSSLDNITITSSNFLFQHEVGFSFNKSVNIIGNLTLTGTGLVDGVDVSQLKSDFDTHEHEGIEINSSGITDGYVLTADGAGAAAWEAIPYVDTLQSVTDRGATTTNEITVPSLEIGDQSAGTGAILSWNDIDGTVDMAYGNGVTLQVGQEQHFYAKAIEAIPDGAPVMFAGAQGDHLLVKRADQNIANFNPKWIIGLATQAFAINDFGYISTFGAVRGLNTSVYTAGDILYLNTSSPGGFTTTRPAAPNHVITLGAVARSHATEGIIYVRVTWSNDLHDLCDVDLTVGAIGDKNLLQYNTSNDTWTDTAGPTLDCIDLRPSETTAYTEGRIHYHDEYKTLTVFTDVAGSSLQLGLEDWVRVYNNTGSTIPDGTPVYATGAFGEVITIAPADANTELKARVIGIATNTILNNTAGWATSRGLLSGIDTSGLTAGQPIHLAPDGTLQNSAPTFPYFPTELGICVVSDATNGYIYVDIHHHTFEQFRTTGNMYVSGNTTIFGDLTVQGTQTITQEANLSISDSFIYLNSGDTIGLANTTFTGTGLDDFYFSNHYEGTTTTTYYLRIDGAGTGTGGVDTFEWSKDNFVTTEATGVDLDYEVLLDNNICAHFEALTGHTVGDKWQGTAAPVNVDTGWFTNRNTGASGVGYTHAGIYFDVTDEKFKIVEAYTPEPSGSIDSGHASFTLGTIVATNFEGLASNSTLFDGQAGSYYLNYNNFTNTPTIGNATITISAGTGLGTGGTFTTNQTGNSTITLVNTDKGSDQNIFKSIAVSGQDIVYADSNTEELELVAGDNVTITTNDVTKQITIAAADGDGVYLPLTGGTLSGALTVNAPVTTSSYINVGGTEGRIGTDKFSASTTAARTLHTFPIATFRTVKCVIQITHGTDIHVTELLVSHDGTTAYQVEYGQIVTNGELATITSEISGSDLNIIATPVNSDDTFYTITTTQLAA